MFDLFPRTSMRVVTQLEYAKRTEEHSSPRPFTVQGRLPSCMKVSKQFVGEECPLPINVVTARPVEIRSGKSIFHARAIKRFVSVEGGAQAIFKAPLGVELLGKRTAEEAHNAKTRWKL